MVRIEKITIRGFKSFAKKTVIKFPSNFSVICGANGSGKSNILDAVCFVLGRISAKSLRAGRLNELIFHGTPGKKPADSAEVTLVFDNTDRKIPVDEDSVVVTRKISRKGISIYKLNGKTVTREKVLEILRPAGIKPDGHNIILQGDVTEVVEMSAQERRKIIDEISGISEFEEKKKKAEKELEVVSTRLREAEIVLGERLARLRKLEAEKEAAEKYRKLSRELEVLRASFVKKRFEEASESMEKLKAGLEELERELEVSERELEAAERELEEWEKKLRAFDERFFKRADVSREAERLRGEILRKKERLQFIEIERSRLESLIEKTTETGNRAVKEVISLGRTGVYGTVSSLMEVPPEYRVAVEVAAGPHLSDVIVKNEDVAVDLVKYLKSRRIGRCTFLPLTKIKPKKPPGPRPAGSVGFAIDLIRFDEKYRKAFEFVFGDTLVVKTIDDARKIGINSYRFVTLDGDLVEKSGAIIGGFYRSRQETSEVAAYRKRLAELEEERKKLESEIPELEKRLAELEASTGDSGAENERKALLEELEKRRERRKKAYERRISLQNSVNSLRIKKARLEAELENAALELRNFEGTETVEGDPETLKERIDETLRKIHSLGPVNMKALEEYEEERKSFEELRQKVEKLSSERDRILGIMADVEKRRRESFLSTLSEVSRHFKKVFRDLTGGDAELRLEDPEDIESGLLIQASPAGKKLISIDAMSGGEKTLTALAFLFALQRFRPAPFYILDEIDAALDKRNTKRVNDLIKKYSGESQFVVISHNPSTIQAADCVYGVTMEEGESKVVGIKMP